jgi:hypothetical protein
VDGEDREARRIGYERREETGGAGEWKVGGKAEAGCGRGRLGGARRTIKDSKPTAKNAKMGFLEDL